MTFALNYNLGHRGATLKVIKSGAGYGASFNIVLFGWHIKLHSKSLPYDSMQQLGYQLASQNDYTHLDNIMARWVRGRCTLTVLGDNVFKIVLSEQEAAGLGAWLIEAANPVSKGPSA